LNFWQKWIIIKWFEIIASINSTNLVLIHKSDKKISAGKEVP